MLEFPGEGVNLRKFCGFSVKISFLGLFSVTLGPSPFVRPDLPWEGSNLFCLKGHERVPKP